MQVHAYVKHSKRTSDVILRTVANKCASTYYSGQTSGVPKRKKRAKKQIYISNRSEWRDNPDIKKVVIADVQG